MRMEVITDFPERLKPGVTVFVGADHRPLRIHSRRWHNQLLLIAFDGFSDPGAVGIFRNWLVYVRADDRPPLPEGDYYHHQLIGLQVIDDRDEPLGQLAEILETGANNVYIVRPLAGPDLLIPAIDEVITQVDLDAGVMRVQLLPGLKLE
jgi:16S rRNA processing protein RimM